MRHDKKFRILLVVFFLIVIAKVYSGGIGGGLCNKNKKKSNHQNNQNKFKPNHIVETESNNAHIIVEDKPNDIDETKTDDIILEDESENTDEMKIDQVNTVENNKCMICLDDEGDKTKCVNLKDINKNRDTCTHSFHKDCIMQWIYEKEEPQCPLCRRNICFLELEEMDYFSPEFYGQVEGEAYYWWVIVHKFHYQVKFPDGVLKKILKVFEILLVGEFCLKEWKLSNTDMSNFIKTLQKTKFRLQKLVLCKTGWLNEQNGLINFETLLHSLAKYKLKNLFLNYCVWIEVISYMEILINSFAAFHENKVYLILNLDYNLITDQSLDKIATGLIKSPRALAALSILYNDNITFEGIERFMKKLDKPDMKSSLQVVSFSFNFDKKIFETLNLQWYKAEYDFTDFPWIIHFVKVKFSKPWK